MKVRLPAISLLCVGLAAALALPERSAVAALVFPLLAIAFGPRLRMSAVNQALFTTFAAFIGLMTPTIIGEPPRLRDILVLSERGALFFFTVQAIAAARCTLAQARPSGMITVIAIVVALTAAGGARTGNYYPVLAALALVLALASLSVNNTARTERFLSHPRRALAAVVVLIFSGGLTFAAGVYLPIWQQEAIARHYANLQQTEIGFSDELRLGSLHNVLLDETVVLRLRGRHQPELLRGAVFSRYDFGRWEPPWKTPLVVLLETNGRTSQEIGPGWLQLEHPKRPERYFLPLDATSIETTTGYVARDELGVHSPPEEDYSKRLWFKRSPATPLAAPNPEDRVLDDDMKARMATLLNRWGAALGSPSERMTQIVAGLNREYEYKLVSERPFHVEPVEEFLYRSKEGHCEFFASAGALLGRAAGVPTRVVSGYRVAETSRFDYSIVRKKHAHAWVEAWTGTRWETYDPTPPGPLGRATPATTPFLRALLDRLSTGWEAVDDQLEAASALQFGLALVVLVGLLIVIRATRTKNDRSKRLTQVDEPLAGFVELCARLNRRGVNRKRTETLAVFAERIQTSEEVPLEHRVKIALAVRAYASLRYGDLGEQSDIESRLRAAARDI